MPKSLIFVLPSLLLAAPAVAADARTSPDAVLHSGRSSSPDTREAWMRKAVGDILEGRAERSRVPKAEPR